MPRSSLVPLVFWLVSLSVMSCANEPREPTSVDIRPEAIRAHMSFLADDLLEGRAVGTRGYALAARYVASQLEAMGLEPAGANRSFYQPVPLREASIDSNESSFVVTDANGPRSYELFEQVLVRPSALAPDMSVQGSMVLVGYGIVEDRLAHDDYDGVEISGKLAVVFSGAPASFASTERAVLSSLEVKAHEAAKRGATALIIIRTPTDRLRLPWDTLKQHAASPTMDWLAEDGEPQSYPEGIRAVAILADSTADAMFRDQGLSLDELIASADEAKALVELDLTAEVRTVSRHRELSSPNVVARLPGRDEADEHVVFSSHLDHVGMAAADDGNGDQIYNGAYDNASGIAVLLEIARSMTSLQMRPRRSILFLAATAEEEGLLGSDYFARYPTVDPDGLVANINVDGALMLHPFLDFVPFGAEHSTIEDTVHEVAQIMSLKVSPDFMPEEVIFVRSDQYSFVRRGVPAVYTFVGNETGNDIDGRELLRAWMNDVYHEPNDDMAQEMDFHAGASYAELNLRIGIELANAPQRPSWKPGDFLGSRFATDRE